MSKSLTSEQMTDLLYYLGASVVKPMNSKGNIQFTCTVHGESHPSAGVNVEKDTFNCFSCHESGSISWLVYKSLNDQFKSLDEVDSWLKDRYGVDYNSFDLDQVKDLKRYDDQYDEVVAPKRKELPLSYIAVFKSGKETYQYFYDRGFTKQTVKDFRIGRDLKNKTVTVPIFWEDHKLAGVIGRYISSKRRQNERYKIYEQTPTADVLFPMDKIEPIDDTVILCEGLLDAVWLHQLGYTNAGALLTNNLSTKQAKWLKNHCKKVIDMTDNDEMGDLATKSIKDKLGKDLLVLTVKHVYPEGCKDPQNCSKEQIEEMLSQAKSVYRKELKRL